jgi:hypothetical protein
MRRKRVTAADLMIQLEQDPEFIAQRHERDRKLALLQAEISDDEATLVYEAAELGYEISSVWDFVNNTPHPFLQRQFVGSYERAYPMLVRHLFVPHHARVREGVIRALTVRDGGELVQTALLEQFFSEEKFNLRWVLANALRVAMPLRERKKHPQIAETLRPASASDA